jgi:hypothetical protein
LKRRFDEVRALLTTCRPMTNSQDIYEVRPRKDKRGADLISDALPFGCLWYAEPNAVSNAVGYAKFFSRSHPAVIRVFDQSGTVIETHAGARYNGTAWLPAEREGQKRSVKLGSCG